MKFVKTKVDGLRVIIAPIKGSESATVMVWVRTGSRFEEEKVNGISHFLEHIVFKGTKKRPTPQDISGAIDNMGAEINAGTSKEFTNFYMKVRSGLVEDAFDILSDIVIYPLIRDEDVEREKGVILEEMAMYEDTPMKRVSELFENLIFDGESLGWDVIGTKGAIKNVKRDDFVSYRKTHYYTENMLITVAGNVTEKEVIKYVKKYFRGLENRGKKPVKPSAKFTQSKPKLLIQRKETDQSHVVIGFRGYPHGDKTEFAEGVLAGVLGGGMSSRMFVEVREKRGLAYAVKTGDTSYMDNGYFETYAGLDTKRVEEAIKVILDQYYGIASGKYQITSGELKKSKEYLKGHLALALEDSKAITAFFGFDELFLGRTRTPKDLFEAIDKVTVEEVMVVAKEMFVPEKLNLAAIGPFKSEDKIEKLLK